VSGLTSVKPWPAWPHLPESAGSRRDFRLDWFCLAGFSPSYFSEFCVFFIIHPNELPVYQ